MLFEGCEFDEAEKTWVWRTEESELWFDEGTVVNLRVEAEKWHDQAPKGPAETAEAGAEAERKVPYAIEVLHQWLKLDWVESNGGDISINMLNEIELSSDD
ncbi:DNA-directed RNA polymerase III complex subunit Rpc25 [Elasticomyces elasticus]|nr:DNA-directed RNA polymerase III complex subunit Rpc25 [Elasticomyces elasticus]